MLTILALIHEVLWEKKATQQLHEEKRGRKGNLKRMLLLLRYYCPISYIPVFSNDF